MKKALILQLARFGDILQTVPLLKNLKRKNYKITILIDEKNSFFIDDIPYIDDVKFFKISDFINEIRVGNFLSCHEKIKKFLNDLNRENFNLLINLNHSEINYFLSTYLNVPKKIGFKLEKRKFFDFLYEIVGKDRKLNPFNLVDIFNQMIENPDIFKLDLGEKVKNFGKFLNYIVIHLGAGHPIRVLDFEIMGKFAKIFLKNYNNFNIILTGTEKEKEIVNKFLNFVNDSRIIDLSGKTDYYELKFILKKAKILISTDTGVMHLASALKTNIIALFFTSAFPFETGPYTENALILTPDLDCYPCKEFSHCRSLKCKKLITPEDILSCCNYFLKNEKLKKFSESIICYRPYFDNWGINLKEITENRDKNYKLREKIRKEGISYAKKF